MKNNKSILWLTILSVTLITLSITAGISAGTHSYKIAGTYIDGCSCSAPCGCELVGLEHGCQGVGALEFSSGEYNGTNLAGSKIAYATIPGVWVRLYVSVKDDKQKEAVTAFGKEAFKEFGKIESVQDAKIVISGQAGNYTLKVNDGKTIQLTTEVVLGGDKKTPVSHTNTQNPLNRVFYQAKTLSGSFNDGGQSFTLKGTNAYFNDKMNASGQI